MRPELLFVRCLIRLSYAKNKHKMIYLADVYLKKPVVIGKVFVELMMYSSFALSLQFAYLDSDSVGN